MKLQQPRENRKVGIKTAEVLRVADERPESEGFDPRFDLPKGETQRLLAMAARGEQPINLREQRKLDALVWLTWVDPKYSEMFRGVPYYDEWTISTVDVSEWETKENLNDALFELDVLFQVNPEMRVQFEGVLKSDRIFLREQEDLDGIAKDLNRTARVLRMIRLWPEKRTELQERFYPPEFRQADILAELERNLKDSDWASLLFAAEVVLLFPELRPQVLEKIRPTTQRWRSIIEQATVLERHITGFETVQHELSSLAILFAERAYITDQGLVKLELPALPVGKREPLPDRLTA